MLPIYFHNRPDKKLQRAILRDSQTSAESKLWERLRAGRLKGFKFYRQYGIGPFIVDFYNHKYKLAIELDGAVHRAESVSRDEERTRWLNEHGISVIRFWNSEVIKDIDKVCEEILNMMK